jgi:hypothetical protein
MRYLHLNPQLWKTGNPTEFNCHIGNSFTMWIPVDGHATHPRCSEDGVLGVLWQPPGFRGFLYFLERRNCRRN